LIKKKEMSDDSDDSAGIPVFAWVIIGIIIATLLYLLVRSVLSGRGNKLETVPRRSMYVPPKEKGGR